MTDRWRKAQIAEEKGYRTRKEIYNWESTQSWEAALANEFSVDFGSFTGKRVLEVGCGCFGPIHYINASCFRVGIDPLLHNYRDILDIPSATHLVTGLAEKLPFRDESFDIILCINVLDHVMEPQAALREIERIIAPKGLLFLDVNVFSRLPKWVRERLCLLDKEHPFHFSAAEVIYSLEQAGFGLLDSKQACYEDTRGSSEAKLALFDKHAIKVLVAKMLGIHQLIVKACAGEG